MPVYEYRCSDCNREFEYQQRMSEDAKTVCEACGGKLERMISRTAFQLKGGGWYKDLYASPKADGGGDGKPAVKKADTASDAGGTAAAAPAAASSSGGDSSGSSSSGGTSSGGSSGTTGGGGSAAAASAAK